MSKAKAIIIGVFVWILGISFYTISYQFSILNDPQLQANLVLALTLAPTAWLGAKLYYRKGTGIHGLLLGTIVFITAMVLDALITVPYFILPLGGSYKEFFTAPAFWLLAAEIILAVYAYWRIRIKPQLPPALINES